MCGYPLPNSVGASGGGGSKPKSFLEIQQEQESDFQLHSPPAQHAQQVSGMPTKPLGSKMKVRVYSGTSE